MAKFKYTIAKNLKIGDRVKFKNDYKEIEEIHLYYESDQILSKPYIIKFKDDEEVIVQNNVVFELKK